MKRYVNEILVILFVLFILIQILPTPIKAQTIAEFEKEVQKFTQELENKKQAVITNEAEVAIIKSKITSIQKQISDAQKEMTNLQKEIEESNEEIKKKTLETEDIMQYYQVSEGNNPYLEYVFGADSVTDMIYRMSIVEQLTDANKRIMDELELLIKKNQEKTKELKSKEVELNKLKSDLIKEQSRIYATIQGIKESMPSVEDQIKSARENVKYYKSLGCGSTEDIQKCIYRVQQSSSTSLPSSGYTLRPTITGIRNGGIGSYSGHIGQDIGSKNKKKEVIYPIAAGYVLSVYQDACSSSWCGFTCYGNANIVAIKHNINNQYIYATYVHLSSVNVKTGQFVSAYTPIGNMGNTGCTSGGDEYGTYIHLHLELATCHWKSGGGCTYSQYLSRILNPLNVVSLPSWWNNR